MESAKQGLAPANPRASLAAICPDSGSANHEGQVLDTSTQQSGFNGLKSGPRDGKQLIVAGDGSTCAELVDEGGGKGH
jgi:hypothetical protein